MQQHKEEHTMRNEFEDAFKTSMNTLRFSPEDKKRITEKIIQTHTEQRRIQHE